MAIILFRVDERLIHGQVVVGWGGQLRPDRYTVVDAAVAESEWEMELYALGVPEGTAVEFLHPDAAWEQLAEQMSDDERRVLLTRDISTMLLLARDRRMAGEDVNLGGIHLKGGREEVLPYLFLDEIDRELLSELETAGVAIFAQDLPGSPKVSLEAILG